MITMRMTMTMTVMVIRMTRVTMTMSIMMIISQQANMMAMMMISIMMSMNKMIKLRHLMNGNGSALCSSGRGRRDSGDVVSFVMPRDRSHSIIKAQLCLRTHNMLCCP